MRILSVTSVKDEAPFLLEWLAWHRILGVTDFVIASNDCSDGTDRMLDALARAGVVHHLPQPSASESKAGQSVQWRALKRLWQHPIRKEADWMLVSDLDEFPVIHAGGHRFADLFAALAQEGDAIALPWRLFGAAGRVGFADEPITQSFLRSAPERVIHPIAATFFKSLFRPKEFRTIGVHRPEPRETAAPRWLDGSGNPLPAMVAGNPQRLSLLDCPPHRKLVELHHYSLRSVESFVVKSARGLPNRQHKAIDLAYWIERNFNTEENHAALSLRDELTAEIAALKALPEVAEIHEAACAHHRAQFEALVRTPAGYALFAQCLHAANSAVLPDRLATALLRRYQQIERPLQG